MTKAEKNVDDNIYLYNVVDDKIVMYNEEDKRVKNLPPPHLRWEQAFISE